MLLILQLLRGWQILRPTDSSKNLACPAGGTAFAVDRHCDEFCGAAPYEVRS
jgi:hypothetical protein